MVKSMTAFGRAKLQGEAKDITIEIKSVNSRFFDCTVKLPRGYIFIEDRIKEHIRKNAVARAKVDVFVTVDNHTSGVGNVGLDTAYLESYLAALRRLNTEFGLADDISVMRVASNPAVFAQEQTEVDADEAWARLSPVLTEAVDAFVAAREREGARLRADLLAKLKNLRSIIDGVDALSAEDVSGYRKKLEERLRTILADNRVTADENRILTECALHADKIAVDEELVRLRSHFSLFEDLMNANDAVGRKLDFLIQEMNREVNTIGSKCADAEIAHRIVDAKNELEKIREQVQNLE